MPLATWIETPESTSIARFGYDDPSHTLLVEYKNERKYKYLDVPRDVFEQMESAPSRGQFINRNIKGTYTPVEVKSFG
jgi:hypothetical protein